MDQHFALIVREPNRFRKPNRLATAVVENLCSSCHRAEYRHAYILRQSHTSRRIASTERSTSSAVVDQFDTEIRIAAMPCQVVPAIQQVPSR